MYYYFLLLFRILEYSGFGKNWLLNIYIIPPTQSLHFGELNHQEHFKGLTYLHKWLFLKFLQISFNLSFQTSLFSVTGIYQSTFEPYFINIDQAYPWLTRHPVHPPKAKMWQTLWPPSFLVTLQDRSAGHTPASTWASFLRMGRMSPSLWRLRPPHWAVRP